MGLVRFALRLPHTFYVLAALIVFLGISAVTTMPTDIFPEINIPVVTVIWQETGLTTPEMEARVTTYSQYAISANVNNIRDIEAQTLSGISVQKIYFQPDVNLDLAIAQIVAATNAIRALLPAGIEPPIVVQYNASSVPVLQLSLDTSRPGAFHYQLARELAPLREQGVLIVGSGDIVHNLGIMDFGRSDGYDWALRFNDEVKKRIAARDHRDLVDYQSLGPEARLAIPTPEHYLPLLYTLALQRDDDLVSFFNDKTVMGSVSMTCLTLGGAER